MITKFQLYEVRVQPRNLYEKHYWLIPTKPIEKFRIALKKIGFNIQGNIDEWVALMKEHILKNKNDKIYVIHVEDSDGLIVNDYWDWQEVDSFSPEKNDFYEGEIEVTDLEVDTEKYNV